MNAQLIVAATSRHFVGRSWRALLLSGLAFGWLVAYGYVDGFSDAVPESAASATALLTSTWFTLYLFAALLTASAFALDSSTGASARLLLAAQTRERYFGVRLATATVIGAIFGLLATVSALISTLLLLPLKDIEPVYSAEFYLTGLGVFLSCISASIAGLFVAMILRSNTAAMATIAIVTLLIEPALQRLQPEFAKYLYTVALSAVYRDDNANLLSMAGGLVISTLWLAVLGGIACRRWIRRDVGA